MGSKFYVGERVFSHTDDDYGKVVEELDNGEPGCILVLEDSGDEVSRLDCELTHEDEYDPWM